MAVVQYFLLDPAVHLIATRVSFELVDGISAGSRPEVNWSEVMGLWERLGQLVIIYDLLRDLQLRVFAIEQISDEHAAWDVIDD